MNELRNRLTAPRMSADKIDELCDHLTKAHHWIEKVEDVIRSREYEEGIGNLNELADRLENVLTFLTDDQYPENIKAAIAELREAESGVYHFGTDEILTVVTLLKADTEVRAGRVTGGTAGVGEVSE